MEYIALVNPETIIEKEPIIETPSTNRSFIDANTISMQLEQMKHRYTIPVFIDNQALISHADFIELTQKLVGDHYDGELIKPAVIKVSHPILGRLPDAKHKAVNDLLESEKTLYYQRMMFAI